MKLGFSYTAGRVCAVATRPLCLFVANNLLAVAVAQGLAIVFLASAISLIGVAADPHRRFYSRLFDPGVKTNGFTPYLFFASLAILLVVGFVATFGITWRFTQGLLLASVAGGYFLTEKLVDEVLRLRLFEREFEAWGRLNVARSVAQLLGLGLAWLVAGEKLVAWHVVLLLAIGNLVVVWPKLPRGISRAFLTHRVRTGLWLLRRAFGSLLQNWSLWFITIASASVNYLDRLLALVLDPKILPLFMLVVMCFSVLQMAVDFFYVSRHRRDFLEHRISVGRALVSRDLARALFGGLVLSSIACVVVLATAKNGETFPWQYVLLIAMLQLAVSLTQIPREIIYWGSGFRRILAIEAAFWVLFFAAAAAANALEYAPLAVFIAAVVCVIARLILYHIAARSDSAGRALDSRLES